MKKFLCLLDGVVDFIIETIKGIVMHNSSKLGAFLRKKLYQTTCQIDTGVVITNKRNFIAGKDSVIYHGSYILNTYGKFSLGDNSHLGAFCYVNACYGGIRVGNGVAIGPGTKLISYTNHYEFGKLIINTKLVGDIEIGNNVFIGANCIILPGSKIHDNTVIGAGSLVNTELDGNAVYVGVPARKIKSGWYE